MEPHCFKVYEGRVICEKCGDEKRIDPFRSCPFPTPASTSAKRSSSSDTDATNPNPVQVEYVNGVPFITSSSLELLHKLQQRVGTGSSSCSSGSGRSGCTTRNHTVFTTQTAPPSIQTAQSPSSHVLVNQALADAHESNNISISGSSSSSTSSGGEQKQIDSIVTPATAKNSKSKRNTKSISTLTSSSRNKKPKNSIQSTKSTQLKNTKKNTTLASRGSSASAGRIRKRSEPEPESESELVSEPAKKNQKSTSRTRSGGKGERKSGGNIMSEDIPVHFVSAPITPLAQRRHPPSNGQHTLLASLTTTLVDPSDAHPMYQKQKHKQSKSKRTNTCNSSAPLDVTATEREQERKVQNKGKKRPKWIGWQALTEEEVQNLPLGLLEREEMLGDASVRTLRSGCYA